MQSACQCCWCDAAFLNEIRPFHFANQPLSCGKSVVREALVNRRTRGCEFVDVLHRHGRNSISITECL